MADRIKAPVHRGVAKVPVVMQLEALECGAACLTMILAYYGKWIPLERVREDCGVSRDGSNARNVLRAARYYGLTAMGFRYEPDALRRQGQFPCIVHWNFNHFIVLNGFRGNKVYITDPARGACVIDMEAFDDGFTGICLQFEPNESFTPSGKPKSMAGFALRRLKGATGALVFTLVTSVIAALLGVIEPAFSRVFLDRLLTGRNPEWLMPFIVILGVFDVLRILVTALNAVFSLRISGKLAAAGNTSYMWKVLRLPMRFFSQRMAGDIQQRQGDNATIAGTLINTFAPLLIDSAMLVFYLVVMLRYSLVLTAVGLCSILIDVIVSRYISMKRVNITRVAMRDAGKLAAATSSGIGMIETIKASGAENGYFARWAGYQASVNAGEIAYQKLNSRLGMVPQLVSLLANDVVLVAGVALVMRGSFTVGMVTAFQGFLGAFMAPAMTLITAGQTLQEMRTQMERVDDVMEYPEDKVFAEDAAQDGEYTKLSGEIELRDVSFGYAPLDAPIIRDLNLTIHKGQSIAFVGASGCGKSTLANLISGMYQPWEGEIRFDGRRLSEIDKGVFRGSLAVVDQNIILFDDTIANNIRMWDDSIEDFEMILAARDAALHDDIMMRPGGYQYRLTEGGRNLSGGQRQRVEIARVLAQDPTIIILDEATSALDARTESEVVRAIRERGITCIVIAHRLSTIRSCDEIVVMEKGVIVDRGRHAQLMSRCVLYNELVSAE